MSIRNGARGIPSSLRLNFKNTWPKKDQLFMLEFNKLYGVCRSLSSSTDLLQMLAMSYLVVEGIWYFN